MSSEHEFLQTTRELIESVASNSDSFTSSWPDVSTASESESPDCWGTVLSAERTLCEYGHFSNLVNGGLCGRVYVLLE